MSAELSPSEKPERLYFKTYIAMLHNSVGSKMFNNFYVRTSADGEFDAMEGGSNACAFYVSSILTIFSKISGVHGTVNSLINDLQASGWQIESKPRAGDVLVWEAADFCDGRYQHTGFYLGDERAVSTSYRNREVADHDWHFGDENRQIEQIFRMKDW